MTLQGTTSDAPGTKSGGSQPSQRLHSLQPGETLACAERIHLALVELSPQSENGVL